MKILDRIKEWASFSDDEKVVLGRRMFLKGLAVTSGGLLVAGPTIFDMGRDIVRPRIIEPDYSGLEQRIAQSINPCGEIPLSEMQVCGLTGFRPGDMIKISGQSGASNYNNGIFQVTAVTHVLSRSGASSSLIIQAP